ncbi:MAG TPA: hypothetical protein PKH10_00050 [bacterium]|nr:hypothetical protein [bacterium]
MTMPIETGRAGEKAVIEELKTKRFSIIKWDSLAPGAADIEAAGVGGRKILVQVKASVEPNLPTTLSGEEERGIRSRAAQQDADAYEARVLLDETLQPAGKVRWRKL